MSGPGLTLKSPAMAEAWTYKWPLSQGRGNGNRGSEDKSDEATEIIDTIKWVGIDHPEVAEFMGDLLDEYDGSNYESMKNILDAYNKGITELLNDTKTRSVVMKRLNKRPSRKMLKHILMQVYNMAIADPAELNHYEPFSPEVYGETSFELINQMIDQLTPITEENKFIDLGSGVGQVVLQMAALTDCKMCYGIEKASIPARKAVDMDIYFRKWMGWYGKKYSEFKIEQGDFFDQQYRKQVSESSIVFVNNFAFGPEVDHMLKEKFADLKDGARIVSSKSFCPLNFRITERNLSDIGTIMHVSIMDPLKGSVSWTGKPVSYYLHVIDSTKLERYFNRKNGPATRRANAFPGLRDESSNESRNSRASSVEKEAEGVEQLAVSTVSSDDSDVGVVSSGRGRGRGRKAKRYSKKKSTPKPVKSLARRLELIHDAALSKIIECEAKAKLPSGCVDDTLAEKVSEGKTLSDIHQEQNLHQEVSASTTPEQGSTSTSRGESPGMEPVVSGGRPVRAAVANAAAIWEAQADDANENVAKRRMRGGGRARGGRTSGGYNNVGDRGGVTKPKKVVGKVKQRMAGLEEMYKCAMDKIDEVNDISKLPFGCVDEKLIKLHPLEMRHQELPSHAVAAYGDIPHGLKILLENLKNDYMNMLGRMKTQAFKEQIEDDLCVEKEKNERLKKREKELLGQVGNLVNDSMGLLQDRLGELDIAANTPAEFIDQAKGIVCRHNDLKSQQSNLEAEIARLEQENEQLALSKEVEIFEALFKQNQPNRDEQELKKFVQKGVMAAVDGEKVASVQGVQKLPSDVTLTRVGNEGPSKKREEMRGSSVEVTRLEVKEKSPVKTTMSLPKMEIRMPGEQRTEVRMPGPMSGDVSVMKTDVAPPHPRSTPELSIHPRTTPELSIHPRTTPELSQRSTPDSRSHPGDMRHSAADLRSHPDNKSRSNVEVSVAHELAFGLGKVSAAPRVIELQPQDYEDRVKMIITSVLAEDDKQKDVDPNRGQRPSEVRTDPRSLPIDPRVQGHDPRDILLDPRHGAPQGPPRGPLIQRRGPPNDPGGMPLPPDQQNFNQDPRGHLMDSKILQDPRIPIPGPPTKVSFPESRPEAQTVGEMITSGIQRTMMADQPKSTLSSGDLISLSVENVINKSQSATNTNASRLSQIIEDSVREHPDKLGGGRATFIPVSNRPTTNNSYVMEGLACPRGTKSPETVGPPRGQTQAPHHRDKKPPGASSGEGKSLPGYLPQVEGLAARFDSYFEKEKAARQGGNLEGFAGRFTSPEVNLPVNQPSSRPTSAGSKSSLHTPDIQHDNQETRKRSSSPLASPVLPPKKQHLEMRRTEGGGDETRQWQDEISAGFDRLLGLAEEVDRRRGNSPANASPKTLDSPKQPQEVQPPSSAVLMKFKGVPPGSAYRPGDQQAMAQQGQFPGDYSGHQSSSGYPRGIEPIPRGMEANMPRSMEPNIPRSVEGNVPRGMEANGSRSMDMTGMEANASYSRSMEANTMPTTSPVPMPGENLPEHHFKKRYFRMQAEQSQDGQRDSEPPQAHVDRRQHPQQIDSTSHAPARDPRSQDMSRRDPTQSQQDPSRGLHPSSRDRHPAMEHPDSIRNARHMSENGNGRQYSQESQSRMAGHPGLYPPQPPQRSQYPLQHQVQSKRNMDPGGPNPHGARGIPPPGSRDVVLMPSHHGSREPPTSHHGSREPPHSHHGSREPLPSHHGSREHPGSRDHYYDGPPGSREVPPPPSHHGSRELPPHSQQGMPQQHPRDMVQHGHHGMAQGYGGQGMMPGGQNPGDQGPRGMPPGGQPPYPRAPYDPRIMQAMAYRHHMMYANRPPK